MKITVYVVSSEFWTDNQEMSGQPCEVFDTAAEAHAYCSANSDEDVDYYVVPLELNLRLPISPIDKSVF